MESDDKVHFDRVCGNPNCQKPVSHSYDRAEFRRQLESGEDILMLCGECYQSLPADPALRANLLKKLNEGEEAASSAQ